MKMFMYVFMYFALFYCRGFFSREGRCTVEFFKQSENKDKLYVALRFESKDMARDILNKYVILWHRVCLYVIQFNFTAAW